MHCFSATAGLLACTWSASASSCAGSSCRSTKSSNAGSGRSGDVRLRLVLGSTLLFGPRASRIFHSLLLAGSGSVELKQPR